MREKKTRDLPGQTFIEGTAPERDEQLDALVFDFVGARKGMEQAKAELEVAVEKISDAMAERELDFFVSQGWSFEMTSKTRLKARRDA